MRGITFVGPVVRGKRPERPQNPESLGFSDTLWGLLELCWDKESSARPTAQDLLDHLSLASATWRPSAEYPAVINSTSSTTDSTPSSSV